MKANSGFLTEYLRSPKIVKSRAMDFVHRYGKLALYCLIVFDSMQIASAMAAPDGQLGIRSSTSVKITLRIPEKINTEHLANVRMLDEDESRTNVIRLLSDACGTSLQQQSKPNQRMTLGNFRLKSLNAAAGLSPSLAALCHKPVSGTRQFTGSSVNNSTTQGLLISPI